MTQSPIPPIAAVHPHEITVHKHTRIDHYYWLRERDNPEVIAHLMAENAYSETVIAHTQELQETLYREMVGRIQETDSSAPVKDGNYYYYRRTEAGQQYTIHCRRSGNPEAPEEVLLDENELAAGADYFKLGVFKISPDHRLLAYSTDTSGGERYTLYVKDLASGQLLADQIDNTSYSVEWANDNRTLFYTIQDEAWRDYKLLRHTLGADPASDVEIYHEADELYRVFLSKTRDQAYLIMTVLSMETSEEYILGANTPTGTFALIRQRQAGIRYHVDHRQGTLYILTNENAPNYKLMSTAVTDLDQAKWQEMIPHRTDTLLERIELFANHLAIFGRTGGLQTIDVYSFQNGKTRAVTFPEPVYAIRPGENREFETAVLRFVYTSLTTSDSVIDYDMETQAWTLVKQEPVLGGYDAANYLTERIWATAEDGVPIPISLVYRKGTERDGRNPCLLYAYGSYGASTSPAFDHRRLVFLDRGFVYAIAHVRGGQEMGRHWYDQGKFLNKKNTFTDFIACARHLIAEKYTRSDRLAIMGRSAGGLLMGAVTTMAPELFKAVVAGVPFVDVVSTMLDESIPLTVAEFEEWGNPKDETYYHYMLSYSPYDNTRPQAYPHLLVTAGLNDPRVQYWEPAKWVAKLRAVKTDGNRLLLKTNMGAGHFSSSGRYDYLKDMAFEYAFVLDAIGIH